MRTKRKFVHDMLETIDQAGRRGEIDVSDMLYICAGLYTMVKIHAHRVCLEDGMTKLEIDDDMQSTFKDMVKSCEAWIVDRRRG